ncbi:unnamed protein product [Calypogeia fissa]
MSPAEEKIHSLDEKTGASLKLTILNPKGRIWTMVVGSGASVIYADTVRDLGYADEKPIWWTYAADRRAQFETLEYTDEDYQHELEHIEKVSTPLVLKCKDYGRAIRIGTNHGSLSVRIMSYYGDFSTRNGNWTSYHNFLFSMKASNPVVMVQAYRLLVSEMYVNGWDYPLHLGVIEAGEGEDGRVTSAIGIGSLLQDGLGHTIRVSLTEEPEFEIEPCTKLANLNEGGC